VSAAAIHAFQRAAGAYDRRFTTTPLGTHLRVRVWSVLDAAFETGSAVLDLGCGTGADAMHLARAGVVVTAIDVAPGMASRARRRLATSGAAARVVVADLERPALAPGAAYDGAYANFGVLNCVADRPALGDWLGAMVRPGAPLVAVVMGPFCIWELAWYAARADRARAGRRLRARGTSAPAGLARNGAAFTVAYPSPALLETELGPVFELRHLEGLGVVLPPTYAADWLNRRPALLAMLARCDRAAGSRASSALIADHYIATFRRR
jgi:SAM-dependent methyltransferase